MKKLSTGMMPLYRVFQPTVLALSFVAMIVVSHGRLGLIWIAFPCMIAWMIWFGRRLSDVWLDGDALQIKGPGGSFRVPLSEVLMLKGPRQGWSRGQRLIVLGLDHPVGKVDKVRFIPEGDWVAFGPNPADALGNDLQARIHAARAARAQITH